MEEEGVRGFRALPERFLELRKYSHILPKFIFSLMYLFEIRAFNIGIECLERL